MNRVESFLLGLVVGIGVLYGTMHYTVVRAKDGFHFIPKITAKLDIPYTDIRSFKIDQWQRKQTLAMSIMKAKKGYLLADHSLTNFKSNTEQLLQQFAMESHTASSKL